MDGLNSPCSLILLRHLSDATQLPQGHYNHEDNPFAPVCTSFDTACFIGCKFGHGRVPSHRPRRATGHRHQPQRQWRRQFGGGIYTNGTLTVTNSALSGNVANDGGGIFNSSSSTLTVNNSAISGNSADTDGGGIYNNQGTLTVNNSAISSNTVGADGGGIYSYTDIGGCAAAPRTIIRNSTLSGNSAGAGGGIRNENGVTEISNSAITTNTAVSGGGVWSRNNLSTCTRAGGTIIAGNTGNDVAANSTTQRFFSLGHNLIGTAGANVDFTLDLTKRGI
jgi:hypothetical protein